MSRWENINSTETQKNIEISKGGMRMEDNVRIPLLGEEAPEFRAITTTGKIEFPKDYKGKWVVLFSHPADFTPVCTTEFMTFTVMAKEFEELNTELIGLSVDSLSSHIAWLRRIQDLRWKNYKGEEIKFPVIADISMNVAKKYGMIHPSAANTQAVRAVFVIDPKGIIRTILYYPASTGRNFSEIKRIIQSLQKVDAEQIATPADWQPGDDVLYHVPISTEEANAVMKKSESGDCEVLDWFICFKKEKGKE